MSGTLIRADDFNEFRNYVYDLLGDGASGYGVDNLSSVRPVTRDWLIHNGHWREVVKYLSYIYRHQTGSTLEYGGQNVTDIIKGRQLVGGINSGTLITSDFVDFLTNQASIYTAAPQCYTVDASELTSRQTLNGVSQRSTTWSGTIEHVVSVNWLTTATAQYFFNLGGYIDITASHANNAAAPDDQAWKSIIAAIPTQVYTRSDYLGSQVKAYAPVNGAGGYSSYQYDVLATRSSDHREITFKIKFTETGTPALSSGTSITVIPQSATWTVLNVAAGSFVPLGTLPSQGTYVDANSGNDQVQLNVNSNGTFNIVSSNSGASLSSSWGSPIVEGAGSSYWVRFTLQDSQGYGSRSTTPTTGWLQLNTNRSIVASAQVLNGESSNQVSTYLVEISGSSGGSPLISSGTYVLDSTAVANLFQVLETFDGVGDYQDVDVGQMNVQLVFNSNGTYVPRSVTTLNAGSAITEFGTFNWATPIIPNGGANLSIRYTVLTSSSSGTGIGYYDASSGWESLATSKTIEVWASTSGIGSKVQVATYLIEIGDAASNLVYGSGTYTLSATSAPSSIYEREFDQVDLR